MRTYDELVAEVSENVELYYEDVNVEREFIARTSVEDVLYGISVSEEAITEYWDKLIDVAVNKYEQLMEFERF